MSDENLTPAEARAVEAYINQASAHLPPDRLPAPARELLSSALVKIEQRARSGATVGRDRPADDCGHHRLRTAEASAHVRS